MVLRALVAKEIRKFDSYIHSIYKDCRVLRRESIMIEGKRDVRRPWLAPKIPSMDTNFKQTESVFGIVWLAEVKI